MTGYESKDQENSAGDYLGSYLTDSILCFLFATVTLLLVNKNKMTACKETGVCYSGVVDFAIGPSNCVLNLPNGQVKFLEEFKLQKNCTPKSFYGLVGMTSRLV